MICRIIFPLFLSLLMSSCVFFRSSVRFPDPVGNSLSPAEESVVIQSLRSSFSSVQTLRLLAKGSLSQNGIRQRLRAAILFRSPDQIRMEFFVGNTGYAAAVFVASGNQTLFLDTAEKIAVFGKKNPGSFSGLVVSPEQILEMIMGPELFVETKNANQDYWNIRLSKEEKNISLYRYDQNQYWELDEKSFQPRRAFFREEGFPKRISVVEYGSFQRTSSRLFPEELYFSISEERVEGRFRIEHLKVNSVIKNHFFELSVPDFYSRR